MQALSPAELQDALSVTAQSIARHCGLIKDPSNPDARTEEQRLVDLKRQYGTLEMWPPRQADVVRCEFSAKYLPALVAEYKKSTTPYNTATIMINGVCHLPYFIRFQKTLAASDLVVLQATRMTDDPSDPNVIGDMCQFLSTLLVLQGGNVNSRGHQEDARTQIRRMAAFSGETSDCYY